MGLIEPPGLLWKKIIDASYSLNNRYMKLPFFILLCFCFLSCNQIKNKRQQNQLSVAIPGDSLFVQSYQKIKDSIAAKRKEFSIKYPSANSLNHKNAVEEISNYWINVISNELYSKWKNTPWDFNGTTTQPQHGAIACGYFVNSLLQDMDLKINRTKLSVCAASQMMKTLTPQQRIINLSYLSYDSFNDKLKEYGKGVYIIGLDFHTGFIVNDGIETWFIHSNYIGRKGVTKEPVLNSAALRSSKTRWLISLTNDKDFIERWLKGYTFS